MRLFIQYKLNNTGKSKFLSRLIPELEALGVKVQFKEKKADIALLISRNRNKPFDKLPKCPKVIRLDGLDISTEKKERTRYRVRTRHEINPCDAIIYQSKFCKYMYDGIVKPRVGKTYIIHNGANPVDYVNIPVVKSDYTKNILLVSKWFQKKHRYYKRLHKMWEIAQYYINLRSSDCCFWIAGETNGIVKTLPKHDRIRFLGQLPEEDLKPYMRLCDVILHLSWFSWCDNSLIESIIAGCVPIVSNQGGNAEVVEKCNGIVLGLDKPIAAERIESPFPPDIDRNMVMDAIDTALISPPRIYIPPIHIKNIAKEYFKVFEEVLR